jgi:ABC-2 type transport system permease protein
MAGKSGGKEAGGLGPGLGRLFRRWRLAAYLDLLWTVRDPRQFLAYYLADGLLSMAAVTAMLLLAERFAGIGAWSKGEVIFMLGYATLTGGLLETFFNFNVAYISRRIGRGQLDHLLVQPGPLWLALLTEGFVPVSGSAMLLPGGGLMIWAAQALGLAPTPAWLGLVSLNLAASVAIVLSFSYLWGSLAFWAPRAAEEVSTRALRLLDQLKPFPLNGLSPALLASLLTVLPAGLVAWYPARALLALAGRPHGTPGPWPGVFVTPAAALLFALLAGWVFRKGMEAYGRTGSQRYLSMGHRR